jgi:hypothetical protein
MFVRPAFGTEAGGGILFQPLANFQFDRALKDNIVGDDYLNGCFELGKSYPELCASVYGSVALVSDRKASGGIRAPATAWTSTAWRH